MRQFVNIYFLFFIYCAMMAIILDILAQSPYCYSMDLMERFYENLSFEVKRIGKKEFAQRMGYSRSGWDRILNGDRGITIEHLQKIEQVINKPIYQLFLDQGEAKKLNEEKGKMREYQAMIEIMELVPFIRNQMMARFEDLVENHPEKIREAKKKGLASLTSR